MYVEFLFNTYHNAVIWRSRVCLMIFSIAFEPLKDELEIILTKCINSYASEKLKPYNSYDAIFSNNTAMTELLCRVIEK